MCLFKFSRVEGVATCMKHVNPLKPNGNCIYAAMTVIYFAFCVCGFRTILDLNCDYFLKLH
jgi:hypothetical protein